MVGIYLHIPFCKKKCSYCDFHFSTSFHSYKDQMLEAMAREVHQRSHEVSEPIETIYFGGGTPSLLTGEELERLLSSIHDGYSVIQTPEVTLEVNPDDVLSSELIEQWMETGINRISLGVQSFRDKDLIWMNRAHSAADAERALERIKRSGMKNMTLDLIYGLPSTTAEEWSEQIDRFLELDIPHLSAYCLTVEGKTSLNKWVNEGRIHLPDEEGQAEHFEVLVDKLERAGFEQYEISNFAKPGFRSKHNTSYWEGKQYLGIGPSAHSFDGVTRRWNVSNNQSYMASIRDGSKFWEEELLDERDRFNERLMTGLRRIEGVRMSDLFAIHAPPKDFDQEIEAFVQSGWVNIKEGVITLSKQGRLRADHIASSLFVL